MPHRTEQADSVERGPQLFAALLADRGTRTPWSTGCVTPLTTELANADVSVYPPMKLLAHESMVTSQRYVSATGTETRTAAAQTRSTTC